MRDVNLYRWDKLMRNVYKLTLDGLIKLSAFEYGLVQSFLKNPRLPTPEQRACIAGLLEKYNQETQQA